MQREPAAARLPTGRRGWAQLLASLGLRPRRGLGQNFLVEHGVVARIVRASGIAEGDTVLEIGPGLGILTAHLLDAGTVVTAIELDRQLVPHLSRLFGDFERFELVQGDALAIDLRQVVPADQPYRVVANLPYSAATAAIMRLLEHEPPPASMTVMVQREVADRLLAGPPNMTVLGVAGQLLAEIELEFTVSPGSFLPPPKVESSVVTFRPRQQPLIDPSRRPQFFQLVNAGFRHKRKQLLNSMGHELDTPREAIVERLTRAHVDPMRRAETLSLADWVRILDTWEAER